MKLVNKDVTYLFEDDIHKDILGPVYNNEIKYQGNKQPISLRWNKGKVPHMEWKDDLGHGRFEIYKLVGKFIEKRIGKKFDDVYSEFLKDPRFKDKNMCWDVRPRDIFKDSFVKEKYNKYKYRVDENGIIRDDSEKICKRKNKNLIIRSTEKLYYVRKTNVFRLRNNIISCCGENLYYYLIDNPVLNQKQFDEIFKKLTPYVFYFLKVYKNFKNVKPLYYFCNHYQTLEHIFFNSEYKKQEYIYRTKKYYEKLTQLKKEKKLKKKQAEACSYDKILKERKRIAKQ